MAAAQKPASKRRPRRPRGFVRQMLAILQAGGDQRIAKVRRLRSSVRARRYENDLKLSIAVERLMREL